MKSYYCHIEKTNFSYSKTTNDLEKKCTNKPVNEKILTPFDYPESQRPYQQGRPWKSHFTNNIIDKTADIFISHKKPANYKLALQLRYDRIITTFRDFFEQSVFTKIEFLLANDVL